MNSLDYQKLIALVTDHTKPSARIYTDDKGKPLPNLANKPSKVGDQARLDRRGEYTDLTIEVLEPGRRLLTDALVIQLLKLLDAEDMKIQLLEKDNELIQAKYELALLKA